jgi:hypothetical protein
MSYSNLEKKLDKIRKSAEDEIFTRITKPRYMFDRSILHAAAIENNNEAFKEAIDLLPKANRIEALEERDAHGISTIGYAAYHPELLKLALSQYKAPNKPLHILCHISNKQNKLNLGIAIAYMERDKVDSNLNIGYKTFNPSKGISLNDAFNQILPETTIQSYIDTKELLAKQKNKVKKVIDNSYFNEGANELNDFYVEKTDESMKCKNNMSYKAMKKRLNDKQYIGTIKPLLHQGRLSKHLATLQYLK